MLSNLLVVVHSGGGGVLAAAAFLVLVGVVDFLFHPFQVSKYVALFSSKGYAIGENFAQWLAPKLKT